MTTRNIEADEMLKNYVEENSNDENKIPIKHHIEIDVVEFIDAEELNKKQITFNEAKEIKTNYIREHSKITSTNFLEDTLVQLFNANKLPVMAVEVSSTNFNMFERQMKETIDRAIERAIKEIEEEKGEENNAN